MVAAMAGLVATASMETRAPFSPPFSASRSIRTGMAVVSLALSGTASRPSTRRAVVAKAETRCSGGRPAARSWLRREVLPVILSLSKDDGDQLGPLRPGLAPSLAPGLAPGLAHPAGDGGREQARIDAVHPDR